MRCISRRPTMNWAPFGRNSSSLRQAVLDGVRILWYSPIIGSRCRAGSQAAYRGRIRGREDNPGLRSREIKPLRTEERLSERGAAIDDLMGVTGKTITTVALDFGRIAINSEVVLYLFGTQG